ncbi:WecB/TagA/CpsF family glycosyltransferase [Larkinella sp. C7]|uniref:WecB/TagA/CpsF family glycosyltransferase n=1 Tax=Larkinella sp. C7 TaxID=2576607 RepID=UPI0011115B39|nr:WecB/TagA/CpsF family glycosyltransferase [Larkinella sp. C7]
MATLYRTRALFDSVNYALVDYHSASDIIIEKASVHQSFGVSALAVHGLIESYNEPNLQDSVSKIDLIVPDGQPVRWALNAFFKAGLKDRVYGPTLVLHVLEKANTSRLKIYLYGSRTETLKKLTAFINEHYPKITVCGIHPDRFREATPEEDIEDIRRINESGAHIVLVGRGCPRQEKWVGNHVGKINGVMMAVGAAFDFHAGTLKQAPRWMQSSGLEWLFRLIQEPNRLWKRYLLTNSQFIFLFFKYKVKSISNFRIQSI